MAGHHHSARGTRRKAPPSAEASAGKPAPAPRSAGKRAAEARATRPRRGHKPDRRHRTPEQAASEGPTQVPCLSCGLCCTYIAVDIDPPTTVRRVTQILWYLYHAQVSIYWDGDDEWLLQFQTRCRHLHPDNRCGIYEARPHICRDFDETSCEVNAEDEGTSFYSAPEFLAFLQARRKGLYRKLLESGYLPDDQALHGPPADRGRLPAFETRFRKLRVLAGRS